MKNIIIFIIVFVILVSAGTASLIFLTKKGVSITAVSGPAQQSGTEGEFRSEGELKELAETAKKEFLERTPTTLDTDYFFLTLPPNWEGTSTPNTLPIILIDSKEIIDNKKAEEINFRTNLSINNADLGGNSFKTYIEGLKAGLVSTIPIIEITKEEDATVDGREAHFMEIKSVQQDLKFGTFVALVAGEDLVWAFSFNTLEESWTKYKDVFYNTIEGLKMK